MKTENERCRNIRINLTKFPVFKVDGCLSKLPAFEFHICDEVRRVHSLDKSLFSLTGNVILADFKQVRELAAKINSKIDMKTSSDKAVRSGELNAMGLIDEILHFLVSLYRQQIQGDIFETAVTHIEHTLGTDKIQYLLETFCTIFPPKAVYSGSLSIKDYLSGAEGGYPHRAMALEELLLLTIANLNPAFSPFLFFFDDAQLEARTIYLRAIEEVRAHLALFPAFGPDGQSLWDLLRAPALACPDSLSGQLRWMKEKWGLLLAPFLSRLLTGIDVISEEEKPHWSGSPGPTEVYDYGYLQNEYERFSQDLEWMPQTVLIAKSTLVWLWQLSRQYGRPITRLDKIPDEELDTLARRGFSGLWLIGLWERSNASRTIKQWNGNPEAAASAYSLHDYDIAEELGGWGALCNLRERCMRRGIRLGSDMVPNHTGIDSRWIIEHPDYFLQLDNPPYPQYQYSSGNLSSNADIVVQIEDHYYNNTDCAVVFHHYDRRNNRHRYIYHGNDGTSMPWNDTAQIDFLNPQAREAVIQTIIGVCKQFSIVRFDAAMTLAKRHIQRLWYPEPGRGGDIASRAEHAISTEEFNKRIPNEFWREVVDRCAAEAPNCLLLAEAFWMMEGYFVRTLGMHRVYNSAFMNMLKKEENQKYRDTIKNTLIFDPEILKRFVNFMNNPDEETSVAQFGKGDKYFGICTLMVTMPGLPMFGHGQIEGFEEKYGMEYRRAYHDEEPDQYLVARHEREIFPLMKKRQLFSGSSDFFIYDLWCDNGSVNENVFAYTNRYGSDTTLIFYNNSYYQAAGWIKGSSVSIPQKDGNFKQDSLAQALFLHFDAHYFVLLNEQRSGRWIIRSSKELYERGLFVMLNGYEAQVYLSIYEVEDADFSTWARLHSKLNGGTMKNPQEELEDMLLEELFVPFAGWTKPENIEEAKKVLSGEAELSAANKDAAKAFIETALRFAKEGGYDPFAGDKKLTPSDAKDIFAAWEGAVKSYAKVIKDAAKRAGAFTEYLTKRLNSEKEPAAFIYGYAIMQLFIPLAGKNATGAQAVTLFEYWHFDRKLREAFEAAGIDGGAAYRAVETGKAVMRRLAPNAAGGFKASWAKDSAISADSIITKNYEDEDFRRLLGVNVWQDTVWFNKENFQETSFYASVIASNFAGLEKAASLSETIFLASTKSEYKIDNLIKALKGKSAGGGAKKTTASKPGGTAKKAAAPATSAAKPAAEKKSASEKKPAAKKGK
ncbi:hypothetical protein FACS189494_01050 [Spirochaetia bacterium]|nr:hypothetical protein FACS189494_01050 [Spirochaetia bacterium]